MPEPAIQDGRQALVRPIAVALCDADQPAILGESPAAVAGRTRPRVRGGGGRRWGRTSRPSRSATACRPVPDLVRGLRPLRARPDRRLRRRWPALSMYGFGALRRPLGRRAQRPRAGSVRRRACWCRSRRVSSPAAVASASDNIPDGWRTVAPHARAPARRRGAGGRRAARAASRCTRCNAALALGASRVVYVDTDESRLRLAAELGAETVEGEPPHRLGPFPITVDASLTHEGSHCAIRSTEPGGVCTHTSRFIVRARRRRCRCSRCTRTASSSASGA